ncbi:unnamed protein product [Schistosoma intercalatum]|nr:unnamed protein product [Schistosoma intercalatum]CAH8597650.1 unnamed protein product [Schistosoma intercalatum]
MDIIYSWCIIWCLLNLILNGKIGQAQEDSSTEDPITDPPTFDNTTMTSTTSDFTNKPEEENSTTDDTNYTTIPSYSSTDIITNDVKEIGWKECRINILCTAEALAIHELKPELCMEKRSVQSLILP